MFMTDRDDNMTSEDFVGKQDFLIPYRCTNYVVLIHVKTHDLMFLLIPFQKPEVSRVSHCTFIY